MRSRHSTASAVRLPHARAAWARPLIAAAVAASLLGGAILASRPAQARPATETADADDSGSTDRLIVRYRDDSTGALSRASILAAGRAGTLASTLSAPTRQHLQAAGLSVQTAHLNGQGAHVLKLDRFVRSSDLGQLARQMMARDPNILYAEPDHIRQIAATPNDPMYAQQWHYFEATAGLNLPGAWDLSTGQGVVVAVIDTGVRPHADLAANLLPGYDFISDATMAHDGGGRDSDASDTGDGCTSGHSSWHGTHVSGTIAAVSNNGIGVAGVAWNAKVLPVRALGCGGGYSSDIADAILWSAGASVSGVPANPNPAKVINMSLGGQSACDTTTQNAINTARGLGTTLVVAAGNSNLASSKFSPGNCKGVITVAAVGRNGGKAPYSNYGAEVSVAAPGGNMNAGTSYGVLSTLNDGAVNPGNDSYAFYQGTSMATPHVAGAVALMLARNPRLTPDEIQVLLRSTARKFPAACAGCGTGIVDATAAVKAVFVSTAQATDVTEGEPNDTYAQAQALSSLPARVAGSLATAKDLDTYRVSVPVNGTITARLTANAASNYTLALRNSAGTVLSSSAAGVGLTDTLSWTNKGKASADLYIRVSFTSGGVGDTAGHYWLEVSR